MNIIQHILEIVHKQITKLTKRKCTSGLELWYERHLKSQHIKYKKQYKVGNCHVDFYLPQINTLVEINGCYAHCCKYCGFNTESYGISASEKRKRDERRIAFLKSQGFEVMIIWQHEMLGRKVTK